MSVRIAKEEHIMKANTQLNNLVVFGGNLKEFRIAHKISQEKINEELGLDIKAYRKIECGKVSPRRGTIMLLLNFFKKYDQKFLISKLLKTA